MAGYRCVPAVIIGAIAGLVSSVAVAETTVWHPEAVIQANASTKGPTCFTATVEAERRNRIPAGMILAIAIVESSRDGWPRAEVVAGGGDAVWGAAARQQASRGPALDAHLGCMQLSYRYHRRHFGSASEMLNPMANVSYGADYLSVLREITGSWTGAVTRYQGGEPDQSRAYVCRVRAVMKALGAESYRVVGVRDCARTPVLAEDLVRSFRLSLATNE